MIAALDRFRRSLFAIALGVLVTTPAFADVPEPPRSPEQLKVRTAKLRWDKNLLRANFTFHEAFDARANEKLLSGLPTNVAVRAYVMEEGSAEPVALAVQSCSIVYDLWDEVFRIRLASAGGERNLATVSVPGVLRRCAEVRDLPIVKKSLLKSGKRHYLAVIVEINPVSPKTVAAMRRWVAKPPGLTGIGPSDALFGSFVGLFVRRIGSADRTLRFRTPSVKP